jgi:hypothetical protein
MNSKKIRFWQIALKWTFAIAIIQIIILLFFKQYVPINHTILLCAGAFPFFGTLSLVMILILRKKT